MEQDSQEMMGSTMAFVTGYGINVLIAIAILIVGWMVASWARGAVIKGLSRVKSVDETLRGFFGSLAKYVVIIVTVIAVLNRFGVETTSLVALVGAAGLAIGLALQGTLSNVAAGVMLLLFRPFKAGDFIDAAGLSGTVKSISLFVTEMATPDNVQIIAPNSQLWGAAIKNFSFHENRRLDLVMGIAYEDDMNKAMAAIYDVVRADARSQVDPEPFVAVAELADSSVNFTVRVWCKGSDYWPLKFDLTKALKERFDADGISIPYPQHQIHMAAQAS